MNHLYVFIYRLTALLVFSSANVALANASITSAPPPYLRGNSVGFAANSTDRVYPGSWAELSFTEDKKTLQKISPNSELVWISVNVYVSRLGYYYGKKCGENREFSILVDGKTIATFEVPKGNYYSENSRNFKFFLSAPILEPQSIWVFYKGQDGGECYLQASGGSVKFQDAASGVALASTEPQFAYSTIVKLVNLILEKELNPPGQTENLKNIRSLAGELGAAKPNQMIFWATALYNNLDRLVPILQDQMAVGNQGFVSRLKKAAEDIHEYYGVGLATHSIAAEMPSVLEQLTYLQTTVTPTSADANALMAFKLAAEDFNSDALTAGDAALGGPFGEMLRVYEGKEVEVLLKRLATVSAIATSTTAKNTLLQMKRLREFFNSFN